jgi:hypothetical protein
MTFALGLGTVTRNSNKEIIEVWFPEPLLTCPQGLAELLPNLGYQGGNEVLPLRASGLHQLSQCMADAGHEPTAQLAARGVAYDADLVLVVLATDAPPSSVAEGY